MFTNAKEVMIHNKKVKKITDVEENMTLYINANMMARTTQLTLNVPLSLTYSDSFNITGVLADTNDNV